MGWLSWVARWADVAAAAAAVLLAFVVLSRIYILHGRVSRMRAILFGCWENYLDALSVTVERLKSLRAYLAQLRPSPQEADLRNAADAMYKRLGDEIAVMEDQLRQMAAASDEEWYDMVIQWRPALSLRDDIVRLVAIARRGISPEQLEVMRRQWREEAQRQTETACAEMEARNRDLLAEIETLRAQVARLDELEGELAQRGGANRSASDEEAAARLMAELQDDLDLEQAAARLAASDGEIAYLEKEAAEASDPDEARQLQGRAAWAHQAKRWWTLLHILRRKSLQLDEMSGQAMESAGDGDEERMRAAYEFQEMEARAKELQQKVDNLSAANRRLNAQLGNATTEHDELDKLRRQVEAADMARKNTQRELEGVENMLAQSDETIQRLTGENKRLSELGKQLTESESALQEKIREIAEVQKKADKAEIAHAREVQQLEDLVANLQKQLDETPDATEGMVPEDEVLALQKAYDELNAQMRKEQAAHGHAREELQAATKAIEKLQHEHRQLQQRYRDMKAQAGGGAE